MGVYIITLSGVSDYMQLTQGYGVSKLKAPAYLLKYKLSELGFGSKGKYGVAVLLIQREDEIVITPDHGEVIKQDDILILVGQDDNIEKLLAEAEKISKEKEAKEVKKNSEK